MIDCSEEKNLTYIRKKVTNNIRKVISKEDSEDLASDVVENILRRSVVIENQDKLERFLGRVSSNVINGYLRQRNCRAKCLEIKYNYELYIQDTNHIEQPAVCQSIIDQVTEMIEEKDLDTLNFLIDRENHERSLTTTERTRAFKFRKKYEELCKSLLVI